MDETLTTVHSALAMAATEPNKKEGPKGTHTFRIHKDIKEEARATCERHGTTLDEYLRQCCEALVNEYRP